MAESDSVEYIASGSFGDIFAVNTSGCKHVLKFAWFENASNDLDSAHVEALLQNDVSTVTPHVFSVEHFDGVVDDMQHCLKQTKERNTLFIVTNDSEEEDIQRYDRIVARKKPANVSCQLMYDRCEDMKQVPIKIMKMPFANMKTLKHVMRHMPVDKLHRTLFQVYHALHQAQIHVSGFRHNDLHLGNVLMTTAESIFTFDSASPQVVSYLVEGVQFDFTMGPKDGIPIIADFGLATSSDQNNAGVYNGKQWVNKPRSTIECPQFDLFNFSDDFRRVLVDHLKNRCPKNPVWKQILKIVRCCSPRSLRSGSPMCSRFSIRRQRQLHRRTCKINVQLDGATIPFHRITPASILLSDCFKAHRACYTKAKPRSAQLGTAFK